MAYKNQAFILLFTLFTVPFTIEPSLAADDCVPGGGISVYWGQNSPYDEGTLQEACATGNYNFAILDFLYLYDDGSTPELRLTHCGSEDNPCTNLESEIQYCQSLGIKVFLSIGGDRSTTARQASKRSSTRSSSSEDVVSQVAEYIYENFLSNQFGPLGSVALDGIDFYSAPEGTNIKWDELVRAINASTTERKIYLSASPHCQDNYLGNAIETGLFDYIWVQYFHEYGCEFLNNSTEFLFKSWDEWTSKVLANNSVFLGIPGAEEVALASGWIPPDVLNSEVLPYVKQADNYGGVAVWNRFYDKKGNVSAEIKDNVPKVCDVVPIPPLPRKFYSLLSQYL